MGVSWVLDPFSDIGSWEDKFFFGNNTPPHTHTGIILRLYNTYKPFHVSVELCNGSNNNSIILKASHGS